jgi:hypothetical protein
MNNIIIELDGPQHFTQVSNWGNPQISRTRDYYKMQCAILNHHKIIRIAQAPVWNDTIDWQSKLRIAILLLSDLDDRDYFLSAHNIPPDTYYIVYIGPEYKDFPHKRGIITI